MEDINYLIERNSKFGRQWRKIAMDFEGKSARQCAYMYDKISSSGTYAKFNRVDDIFLLDLVKMHGYNWTLIQTKMPKFSVIQLKNRYNKVLLSKILNNNSKRKISTCKLYKVCIRKKEKNKSPEVKQSQDLSNSEVITQSDYQRPIQSDIIEFKPTIIINNEEVKVNEKEKNSQSLTEIKEGLKKKVATIFNRLKLILKVLLEENKKMEAKYPSSKELQLFNKLLIQKMKRILLFVLKLQSRPITL